ncbi:MAG: ATP-binding protein [Epsilonproteobacteria bacterium]|nr:ATP-binding protein [Campylobacterota bacterium]
MGRSINARIKKAGFPYIASERYDFSLCPKLDEKLIRELDTLSFLDN